MLLIAVLSYVIIESTRDEGSIVRVSVDGDVFAEYPLCEDGEYEINGGTNLLVIENGSAYMKYASCPDGLCKNQGRKSLSGEKIVCLPNRVLVEIFAD